MNNPIFCVDCRGIKEFEPCRAMGHHIDRPCDCPHSADVHATGGCQVMHPTSRGSFACGCKFDPNIEIYRLAYRMRNSSRELFDRMHTWRVGVIGEQVMSDAMKYLSNGADMLESLAEELK